MYNVFYFIHHLSLSFGIRIGLFRVPWQGHPEANWYICPSQAAT